MESRTKNASRNILSGLIYNVVSVLCPFLTRTVLIYVLGIEYVGLGSLFMALLGVLSMTEAGIGSALVYQLYKPVAEGDIKKVNALYNFYKKCYKIIGTVILVFGGLLFPFLPLFVKSGLPIDVNLYVLYGIFLFNTVSSYFLFAYKNSLLVANQRNDINNNLLTVTNIVRYTLEILLLLYFRNYYVYAIVCPVMTVVANLIRSHYVDKLYPQYVCEGTIDKEDISNLKTQVGGLLFHKIGDVVLTNIDPIIISAYLGLTILGKYNNYYYIITALFGILGVLTSSIVPSVGNTVFTKDKHQLLLDFQKFTFVFVAVTSWISICYLCLVQPFIELWIGKENQFDTLVVVLLFTYLYTSKINDMIWVYRQASGLWWKGKSIPLISAIVNLVTTLILVQYIGLPGIIISTLISRVFVMLPMGSHSLFHYLFHDMKGWKNYIGYQLYYGCATCLTAGIVYFVCTRIMVGTWETLFFRGIICVLLPLPIYCLLNIWHRPFKMSLEFGKCILKNIRLIQYKQ